MNHANVREELAQIDQLKEHTRLAAAANGHYFIVWGLVISMGLAYNELHALLKLTTAPPLIWMVLVNAGWLYTFITIRRERRAARTTFRSDRLLTFSWVSCGISLTLMFVGAGMVGRVPVHFLPGLIATFLAPALIVNGRVAGLNWLVVVGALWWVCALVLFTIPPVWSGLTLAGCLFALFVIPGMVLRTRARRIANRTA